MRPGPYKRKTNVKYNPTKTCQQTLMWNKRTSPFNFQHVSTTHLLSVTVAGSLPTLFLLTVSWYSNSEWFVLMLYWCTVKSYRVDFSINNSLLNVLKIVLEVDECLPCQSRRPTRAHTQFKFDGKQVGDGLQRHFSQRRYSSYISSSETAALKLITDRNLFCPATPSAYIIFSISRGRRHFCHLFCSLG